MQKDAILLPLIMSHNPKITKTKTWHDNFFQKRDHGETIRVATLHSRFMSICLDLPQPHDREEQIKNLDDVALFGGNLLMNKSGHEGIKMTWILGKLVGVMTDKKTIWGPFIEPKFNQCDLNISKDAYWVSADSTHDYPKAKFLLMDHDTPLFNCPFPDVLAQAVSKSMNDIDSHKRDIVFVVPVFMPGLTRNSTAHETLSYIAQVKKDIKLVEDRKSLIYSNQNKTEVLNPIIIDSLW